LNVDWARCRGFSPGEIEAPNLSFSFLYSFYYC
jgi:hypothetical protein